jgi:hypothetical protein
VAVGIIYGVGFICKDVLNAHASAPPIINADIDHKMAEQFVLSEVKWADSQVRPSNQEIESYSDTCISLAITIIIEEYFLHAETVRAEDYT